VLYSSIPYTLVKDAQQKVDEILRSIFKETPRLVDRLPDLLEKVWKSRSNQDCISSKNLCGIIKAIAALLLDKTKCVFDVHQLVIQEMRKRNLAMPLPII